MRHQEFGGSQQAFFSRIVIHRYIPYVDRMHSEQAPHSRKYPRSCLHGSPKTIATVFASFSLSSHGALLGIILLFAGAGCSSAEERAIKAKASAVESLTEAHTRIVWVQDAENLNDVFARGNRLRLMAYDSRDGQGERILLPGPGSFGKPMLTTDGAHVVYSDHQNNSIHVVDWSGQYQRVLADGRALALWFDPATKIEWLYVGTEPVATGAPAYHRVERHRLDLPGQKMPVWQGQPVGEDNFQLSADGRVAGGNFPWPECGLLHIEQQRIERIGRGCWTSLAPDDSYRFWIFDGSHRQLLLFDTVSQSRHTVPIAHAPGIDGHEVYHPRWSNHPRIMAMTGPYKIRSGGNNIRGGGADVELHLGRFGPDFKQIEHWVQVTENPYANFFPDVWVAIPTSPSTSPAAEAPITQPAAIWPSSRAGLVYLWEHAAARNEVVMPTTGQRRTARPDARRLARFGAHHTMWVDHGYFVDTYVPPIDSRFSIEGVVYGLKQQAALLHTGNSFSLVVQGGEWIFRVQNLQFAMGSPPAEDIMHFVLTAQPDQIDLHINGVRTTSHALDQPISFAGADALYWGGHPEHGDLGPDRLSHLAIYDRPLSDSEIGQHAAHLRGHLAAQETTLPVLVQARVVSQSAIPTPADIAPYRRALVFNEYEIIDGTRTGERLLAAHWAILDGQTLPTAERPLDHVYTLALVLFDDRPELEGERIAMDNENFLMDWYYDLNL